MTAVRHSRKAPTINRRSFLSVGLALSITGCAGLTGSREPRGTVGPVTSQTPTAQQLVNYVNNNAGRVSAIESADLALEVKSGSQGGGLSGTLYCEKPKNFRLRAKAVGKPMADFGSNDQEFWYWISQDNPPYLYHCSYAELARGNVALPFPFQPDWVLETLGMAELPPAGDNFRVERRGNTFELTERATSSQGRPVFKVTVFNGGNASGAEPQIKQHRLHDERGELVALADVISVRRDAGTGATVAQHLKLKWPQQKLEMELKLDGLKVHAGPVLTARAPQLFQRSSISDLQSFDLATRQLDSQPSSLQRMGGFRGQ
jgi:hypothetical protein